MYSRLHFLTWLTVWTYACLAWAETRVAIDGTRWTINGQVTNPGTSCEGLLMNVRMVNATFADKAKTDFDPDSNTDRFVRQIPDYAAHGVSAFTLCLQGGMPGYEGAHNSAFQADGSLEPEYLARVERVIRACDAQGIVVILGLFYQRQSKVLSDESAVRAGVVNAMRWVSEKGFKNVLIEIANEYPHRGFAHECIRSPSGQASLLKLAKETAPGILLTASGYGDGKVDQEVAAACDFLTPHWNGTKVESIGARVTDLKKFGKPIVCNEDDKTGQLAVAAMRESIRHGASYGLMLKEHNQAFPFHFDGHLDDPEYYQALLESVKSPRRATVDMEGSRSSEYFPIPESQGGWRSLNDPASIAAEGGMDPGKLEKLRQWLLDSDSRDFAAVVIRHGYMVLQVERGKSSVTDTGRVASVSKAICATALAIAAERSQSGLTPHKMNFDDRAFQFLPWAQPLSDPRKAEITVRQLLNHTSGILPEALGAPNDGRWEYILGHDGNPKTQTLAFDPGTACGYSTHAFVHASLVCEHVTGQPYDQFAIEHLFRPLGIEKWWFQKYTGRDIDAKPSHGVGLPARELARIGYCMLHRGRWRDRQVIPEWFVEQSGVPSSTVQTPELRWKLNPQVFSLGWELPARHYPESRKHIEGIPRDARYKPGSGGQLLAFVPSLDLVIARQTGASGAWDYEEFLRQACDAVAK